MTSPYGLPPRRRAGLGMGPAGTPTASPAAPPRPTPLLDANLPVGARIPPTPAPAPMRAAPAQRAAEVAPAQLRNQPWGPRPPVTPDRPAIATEPPGPTVLPPIPDDSGGFVQPGAPPQRPTGPTVTRPITGQERPDAILPGQDPFEALLPMLMQRYGQQDAAPDLGELDPSLFGFGGGGTGGAAPSRPMPMAPQPSVGAARVEMPWDEKTFKQAQDLATRKAEALLAERGINWSESEAPKAFGEALLPLLMERQGLAAQVGTTNATLAQQAAMANANNALESYRIGSSNSLAERELTERARTGDRAARMDLARLRYGAGADARAEGENRRRFDLGFLTDTGRTLSDTARAGRNELRGERGYLDDLNREARDQAIQEAGIGESSAAGADDDFLRILMEGLGQGNEGLDLLGGAAGGYDRVAGQYGDQSAGAGDDLSALAQLATLLRKKKD